MGEAEPETASRMESTGDPGRIQVTEETFRRLCSRYDFEPRGQIEVRGKGPMSTYFLISCHSAVESPSRVR